MLSLDRSPAVYSDPWSAIGPETGPSEFIAFARSKRALPGLFQHGFGLFVEGGKPAAADATSSLCRCVVGSPRFPSRRKRRSVQGKAIRLRNVTISNTE